MNLIDSVTDTSRESKREQAKAKTRHALLKSALQLYSAEGACGMSMNKIAKNAGIAQPSFYNHFDSLEALQNELSEQLKHHYLSPMRMAWITMLKDYTTLTSEQFYQRCQYCLTMIFDAAFQNIELFGRLIEDGLRATTQAENHEIPHKAGVIDQSAGKGLGSLIGEIKEVWAEIFAQGLTSAQCTFEDYEVNLCVDVAVAQVHELILGCHHERYSRQQAIAILCKNFDVLFGRLFHKSCS